MDKIERLRREIERAMPERRIVHQEDGMDTHYSREKALRLLTEIEQERKELVGFVREVSDKHPNYLPNSLVDRINKWLKDKERQCQKQID